MTFSVFPVRGNLPDRFKELLDDSLSDGHQFLEKLQTNWLSGANTFSRPGERLLAVSAQSRLAGIGGINVEPYLHDSTKGRIRHLYVHTQFRGQGIAAMLLNDLEKEAAHHFKTLTLRTSNPAADLLYRKHGFRRVDDSPFVTHQKELLQLVP